MIYLSIALGILFAILALEHFRYAYKKLIKREHSPSYAPLINGFIGLAAILIYPDPSARQWWWVPFIIDWGCLPMLLELVVFYCFFRKEKK